ncbi:MAG: LEPR-XLL domain-containing protein, partial [Rariglobus sp.]
MNQRRPAFSVTAASFALEALESRILLSATPVDEIQPAAYSSGTAPVILAEQLHDDGAGLSGNEDSLFETYLEDSSGELPLMSFSAAAVPSVSGILASFGLTDVDSLVNDIESLDVAGQASALLGHAYTFLLTKVGSFESAFAAFSTALTEISDYLSSVDPTAASGGFDIPTFSLTLPTISIDGALSLVAPVISVTGSGGSSAHFSTDAGFSGKLTVAADSASLAVGSFSASITDGIDADTFAVVGSYDFTAKAFDLTLDTFSLSIGSALAFSGSGATVSFTSENIGQGAFHFSASDADLAIGDVALSGDFGFHRSSGGDLLVVGSGVAASLSVGTFDAGFTGGSLALKVKADGTFATSVSATSLVLAGAGFGSATATAVSFTYNNTGFDFSAAPESLSVGTVDRTLSAVLGTTANPFVALSATGVAVTLGELVTLFGSFTFSSTTSSSGESAVVVAVSDLAFSFGDGVTSFVSVSGGSGAFIVTDDGAAASFTVIASLAGVSGVAMSPSLFRFEVNLRDNPVSESVTVGGDTVTLDLPAGDFVRLVADSFTLTVGGLALTGRVAFEQTVRTNAEKITLVQLRETSASFNGTGTDGATIAIQNAHGFLLLNSAGAAGSLAFKASSGFGEFSAQSDVTLEINRTDAAVDVAGSFGSITLDAGTYTRVAFNNLAIVIPGAVITGDFSFKTVLIGGVSTQVIVGNNVTVFVGDNTAGRRVGLEVTDGTAVFRRLGGNLEMGQVTGRIRAVGVSGFDLDAVLTLRLNESSEAFTESFELNGQTVTLNFGADEISEGGIAFAQVIAQNVSIQLSGFATLKGDFVFTRTDDAFVAVGSNITAFAGSGFGTT